MTETGEDKTLYLIDLNVKQNDSQNDRFDVIHQHINKKYLTKLSQLICTLPCQSLYFT